MKKFLLALFATLSLASGADKYPLHDLRTELVKG
jgi:hypothetical protein